MGRDDEILVGTRRVCMYHARVLMRGAGRHGPTRLLVDITRGRPLVLVGPVFVVLMVVVLGRRRRRGTVVVVAFHAFVLLGLTVRGNEVQPEESRLSHR